MSRLLVAAALAVALSACRGRLPIDHAAPTPPTPAPDGTYAHGATAELAIDEVAPPPATPLLCSAPVGPRALRMLTRAEYDATLRDLVFDETAPATTTFPAETSLTGFEDDAAQNVASPLFIERAQLAAEDIAMRAWRDHKDALLPCDPRETGEIACGEMFVRTFGARAFRRPLLDGEQSIFVELFTSARMQWGFDKAGELVIAAMLQSPQFLYLAEEPRDDDVAAPYVIASRLSYLLWGTMPDDALFAAAAADELATKEQVAFQARRLLDDPRARVGLAGFFRQWLGLDRLATAQKDVATYPTWTPDARTSWRKSIDAYIDHVLWEGDATLVELFTSRTMYVDPVLATMMDVQGPDHDVMASTAAPEDERAGLLTQPALMALLSPADQSSPIRRGVFVREKILCQPLPPPPPDVVVQPPDPDPNATTRERFAAHTADPYCAGCHSMIDPIGFGFERYDAIGRYRSIENGLPVDATGFLDGIGEQDIEGPYDGAVQLSQRLAGSMAVKDCVARTAFRYGAGRLESWEDQCTIDELVGALGTAGDFKQMLVALAASTAFRAPGAHP